MSTYYAVMSVKSQFTMGYMSIACMVIVLFLAGYMLRGQIAAAGKNWASTPQKGAQW